MFWRSNRTARKDQPTPPSTSVLDRLMARHGLTNWWLATFTQQERAYVNEQLSPYYKDGVVRTAHPGERLRVAPFLDSMAQVFKAKKDAHIGTRLLDRARQEPALQASDEHFLLAHYIEVRYKQRTEDPQAIADVKAACERMIAIVDDVVREQKREYGTVPPVHPGFDRLLILAGKDKDRTELDRLEKLLFQKWWRHTEEYKQEESSRGP